MRATQRALVAIAAGLALADASIVALALPPLLVEMHTTITGVAAIVGVYALVLAVAILPAAAALRRFGVARAGAVGLGVFALASLACGLSSSLAPLLVARALQAAGGAAGLLAAFAVLDAGGSRAGRRAWLAAALVGTAAGPAIGGALTQVFDWRAIFYVQAPFAAAAAIACALIARGSPAAPVAAPEPGREAGGLWSSAPPGGDAGPGGGGAAGGGGEAGHGDEAGPGGGGAAGGGGEAGHGDEAGPPGGDAGPGGAAAAGERGGAAAEAAPLAALAFTAAAFTAVLFLLVIELVAGFALSPIHAALGVTILPLAAVAAATVGRGDPRARAASGAVLLAGGAAALAFLPLPGLAWTVVPQVLAGAGMGLALPAFTTERTVGEAARHLVVRHAGIVVILAILAPVATARLNTGTEHAILQGTSLVLDAPIDPLQKLALAPALLGGVDAQRPRAGLRDAVRAHRAEFAKDPAAYDRLGERLDDVIVRAVQDAFFAPYLIAAALALLAAALLLPRRRAVALAAALALVIAGGYAIVARPKRPEAVVLGNPCVPRAGAGRRRARRHRPAPGAAAAGPLRVPARHDPRGARAGARRPKARRRVQAPLRRRPAQRRRAAVTADRLTARA